MAIKIWKKYSQTQQSDVEDEVTALVRGLLKKSVKEKKRKNYSALWQRGSGCPSGELGWTWLSKSNYELFYTCCHRSPMPFVIRPASYDSDRVDR